VARQTRLTAVKVRVSLADMNRAATPPRRHYRSPVREAAAAATAERIIDAALARFSTQPYDEVSLDHIARAADVAERTVIRRFGSKEALFAAAFKVNAENVMARRNEAPVGDVRAAVSNVLEHYEELGDQRLLFIAQEHRIPAIREQTEGGRAWHRAWVERTFAPLLAGCTPAVRERRLLALVAATDVYTWKLLRRDLELTLAKTQQVIETLIASVREGGH
jgi:AcrR family transcriptional regulator